MNQQKSTFIFILTLGILSMLPPFGVDMYLPSFLEIAKDLGVSPEQVQHTLTSFAYGMAFGQLFWGPFGDSFGRKPIILLGVIVGALTALVLTEINSVGNFTALRFVQGFFGAAPVVLSGALLRDLFSKDQLSKVMSTITLVFMLAPLVAPIIGGYIVKFFHWHAIFYVISLVGLLAAALVFFIIPETHKKENRIPLRLNIIARNFLLLWKQKEVLGYMFATSFGFGGLFTFVTAGSIVYIGILWGSCRTVRLLLYDEYHYDDLCFLFEYPICHQNWCRNNATDSPRNSIYFRNVANFDRTFRSRLLVNGNWRCPFHRSKPCDFIKCNGISFRKMSSNGGDYKFFDW